MSPEAMARLHAVCFGRPRPWSAAEINDILTMTGSFALTAPQGFLIGRVVAGEAELLTLAVAPEARRRGVASALLDRFAAASHSRAATTAFLEVAADNAPAIALYQRKGWAQAGRRRRYYDAATDALILRLGL